VAATWHKMSSPHPLLYGLFAEVIPDQCIFISGKTFDSKDLLKSMGAVWVPEVKKWKLPLTADLSSLRLQVQEQLPRHQPQPQPKPQPRAQLYEPNIWVYDKIRDRRERPCCKKCKREIDKYRPDGPLWYVCPDHGKWQSDYTGD